MPGMPGRLNPATGNSATTTGGTSFVSSGGPFIGGSVSSPGSQPGTTGYPGLPGSPVNSQTGGVSPYSTVPGANGTSPTGFNQPGTTTGGAAADMIRNILTTPRAGGAPMANMGGQTIGGGIAGIASTAEGEGVKVYNDRTLYQEWEFIFDPAKQKQIPNPNATGAGGTPVDRMNNPNGTGTGTNPINPRSSGGLGR